MADDRTDYSAAAKLLHWLIAAFVLALAPLGLVMTRIENLQLKFELYQLHKSMGVTVLGLMALRVALRLLIKPPPLPRHVRGLERRAAHGAHFGLYALLLLMPLSGWAMVSAAQAPFNFPTVLYGLAPWPHIPFIEELSAERKKAVEPVLKNVHAALGWALIALIILHIAAALRHGFILKDGVMSRMLPRFLTGSRNSVALVFMAALCAFGASPASAQEWALKKEMSRVTFEANAGGQTIGGEFKQFEAEIRFDPEYLEITEISAAIDLNTVSTGQAQIDDALMGKDWFDTQAHPIAGFKVRSVKAGDSENSFIAEAELSIKGNTRPVTLPFELAVDQGEARVTGETTINRLDFGIGPAGPVSGMAIGDTVKVKLDLAATRLDN